MAELYRLIVRDGSDVAALSNVNQFIINGLNLQTRAAMSLMLPSMLPSRWFFTDDRLGDDALALIAGLPRDVGVIVRVREGGRARVAALVRAARRHRHVVLVAGPILAALRTGADGAHLPEQLARCAGKRRPHRRFRLTVAAHSRPALVRARRLGADAAFLSPVFATRSHPGGKVLGPLGFARLARAAGLPVLALGGMTSHRAGHLRRAHGWGAIDAWHGRPAH